MKKKTKKILQKQKIMKECRTVKIKKFKSLTVIFWTKDKINETLLTGNFCAFTGKKKNKKSLIIIMIIIILYK